MSSIRGPARLPIHYVSPTGGNNQYTFRDDASSSSGEYGASHTHDFDTEKGDVLSEMESNPLLNAVIKDENIARVTRGSAYSLTTIVQIFRAWARPTYATNPEIYHPGMRLELKTRVTEFSGECKEGVVRIVTTAGKEKGFWEVKTSKGGKSSPLLVTGIKFFANVVTGEWSA